MLEKCKPVLFRFFRLGNAGRGKINAGHIKPEPVKRDGMPSFPAGKIQQSCAGLQLQHSCQPVDKSVRFLLITIIVQQMVIRAVKPVFKPWGLFIREIHAAKIQVRRELRIRTSIALPGFRLLS